jgi:hypothetical protein
MQRLASILTSFDPISTNLLKCDEVFKLPQVPGRRSRFGFRFSYPHDNSNPKTLGGLLLQEHSTPSLNERIATASSLAKLVIFLHGAAFVHKTISAETVVIFDRAQSYRNSFFVRFDKFRALDGVSQMIGDVEWTKRLYHHPTRQGMCPEENYQNATRYIAWKSVLKLGSGSHSSAIPISALIYDLPG